MAKSDATTREIARAVERARLVLADRPQEMQGTILADLVAMWLVDYIAEDEDATRVLQFKIFFEHIVAVQRRAIIIDRGLNDRQIEVTHDEK